MPVLAKPGEQDRKDLLAIAVVAPTVALLSIGIFAVVGMVVKTSLSPAFIAGFPCVRAMIAATQGRRFWPFLPRAILLSILGLIIATISTLSHVFLWQLLFMTFGLAIGVYGVLPLVRFELSARS